MADWYPNKLRFKNIDSEKIDEIKKFIYGNITPYYFNAIQKSIKVFIAGYVGILKPIEPVEFPACFELVNNGIGESTESNIEYTTWLKIIKTNPPLDQQQSEIIENLCSSIISKLVNYNNLTETQKEKILYLLNKKAYDWLGVNHVKNNEVGLYYDNLGIVNSENSNQFDMRLIIPTFILQEIKGFNGELLDIESNYDLFMRQYGVKWPRGFNTTITTFTEVDTLKENLIIDFYTPNGNPHIEVLVELSKKYYCKFKYTSSRPNGLFYERVIIDNGKVISKRTVVKNITKLKSD